MTPLIVPPSQIEKALQGIWESMKTATKIRSCLFNLVIYTNSQERINYFKNITQRLINSFPCRAILIQGNADNDGKLETQVSVISPSLSHGFVICDLIEIKASKNALNRTPSIAIPHLIPDLPVYFVSAEDPKIHNEVTTALEKEATRIIFDSESCDELASFAKEMIDHHERSHFDIADLNWARLEGWRDMIANCFSQSDKKDMLDSLETINITYNNHTSEYFKRTKIQALFLQAWIASQLKWKIESFKSEKEEVKMVYSRGKKTITVHLLPESAENLWAGAILGIEFLTDDRRNYLFKRNIERPQEVVMHYSSKQECYLPSYLVFTKTESGQSLVREICHFGTSKHYIEALHYLDKLHQKLPCA